jgi:uncharacterized membrane protein
VLWVECKRPDGKGIERPSQEAAAHAYAACGVPTVRECRTIGQALDGLRASGFRLSANADVVADVYQHHIDASERLREAQGLVKRAAGKPRAPRVAASRIRKAHKLGAWAR